MTLDEVMAELETRTAQSGLDEKASRGKVAADGRRSRSSPTTASPRRNGRSYRDGEPMTLTAEDVARLRSLNDPISFEEAEEIYLPLTRLLSLLRRGGAGRSIAPRRGSSASTTRRCPSSSASRARSRSASRPPRASFAALLRRWPIVAQGRSRDDRRLPPSQRACSKSAASWTRRGFPRATTARRFVGFLSDIKSGKPATSRCRSIRTSSTTSSRARIVTIDRPDILIVEGLNILQPGELPKTGEPILFASDFLDFSIYIDADEADLRRLVHGAIPAAARRPPSPTRNRSSTASRR